MTDAIASVKKEAEKRTEGSTSETYEVQINGRQFVGCDLSWVDDKVGTVLQPHLFSTVPSGSPVQLVSITGSMGGAQTKRDYPTIQAVMKSLTVT